MFRDKLKGLIPKKDEEEGNFKKKIENLVFFVIIAVITIIVINIIWNGDKKTTTRHDNTNSNKQLASNLESVGVSKDLQTQNQMIQGETNDLEQKLANILSKIQGVGEVSVFINYSESSEVVAMYNENSKVSNTEETDTSGGTRKIQETDSQKDIIYQEANGEKIPITQKIMQPKVEGAIITAKGADNANTKNDIIQAVEAVTGLATHKIQVFCQN